MKASLQLRLSQQLALTPQLQQSIKLLQMSTLEMNQELERFLNENPLLEREDVSEPEMESLHSGLDTTQLSTAVSQSEDTALPINDIAATQLPDGDDTERDISFDESHFDASQDDTPRAAGNENDERGDNDRYAVTDDASRSLQQHLLLQLPLTSLGLRDRAVASFIIANLDDDGYLTLSIEDLAEMLMADLPPDMQDEGLDIEDIRAELATALHHVQHLDPPGVGARTLAECLALQLRTLSAETPYLAHAILLVNRHLDLLAQRDWLKLRRELRVSEDELKSIRALIVGLEPKPGRHFGQADTRYIVPDVVVKKVRGRWRSMLNRDAMPKLRVNKLYADLLQKNRDNDGKNLGGQLQEARWLIKNIQQRFETILKVTEAIVENQRHFFDHGEVAMRPLVLREIAELVGLHESTVSRVTTQKYMLTPRGIFELKYFFGSSVATETGGTCSATAIRALIKQLVDAEDQRKPLSDNKIADMLSNQGILVARRTVAKYREAMQISPASARKSF